MGALRAVAVVSFVFCLFLPLVLLLFRFWRPFLFVWFVGVPVVLWRFVTVFVWSRYACAQGLCRLFGFVVVLPLFLL